MNLLVMVYIVNATLLLLHEIDSAYEKEWEILNLPGNISGFLLMHIPVILFFFYGLLAVHDGLLTGHVIGIVTGCAGLLPLLVHKLFVRRTDHFNSFASNCIIFLNTLSGIVLLVLNVLRIAFPHD